jgi:hypothetical protein
LQAGGRRFEPGWLHRHVLASRNSLTIAGFEVITTRTVAVVLIEMALDHTRAKTAASLEVLRPSPEVPDYGAHRPVLERLAIRTWRHKSRQLGWGEPLVLSFRKHTQKIAASRGWIKMIEKDLARRYRAVSSAERRLGISDVPGRSFVLGEHTLKSLQVVTGTPCPAPSQREANDAFRGDRHTSLSVAVCS